MPRRVRNNWIAKEKKEIIRRVNSKVKAYEKNSKRS